MVNKEESLYPKDWLKIAKKDWNRIKLRLRENDIEDAAVHLQQALEKYLKGYIISKGWKLQKTHDLRGLLVEAIKYNAELENYLSLCQEVSAYYFEERYPFFISKELTKKEVEEAYEFAKELVKKLEAGIERKNRNDKKK